LGWGAVEVLEPETLRKSLVDFADQVVEFYKKDSHLRRCLSLNFLPLQCSVLHTVWLDVLAVAFLVIGLVVAPVAEEQSRLGIAL
jgi:hypothetical protein